MLWGVRKFFGFNSSNETKTPSPSPEKLVTPPTLEKSVKPGSLLKKAVVKKKTSLKEEFAHETKKQIQNSAQYDELIRELEEILDNAEVELKQKFWVHSQKDQSLLRRSLSISLTAHNQGKEGTCYAYCTTTVARAAVSRVEDFETPPHEKLCAEIIGKFQKKGGDPIEVLEFLQKEYHYPIQWKAEESPDKIQDILENQINQRPYIGAFFFCPENWKIFTKLWNESGRIMMRSDFKCHSPYCLDKSHYGEAKKIKPEGHGVVLEKCISRKSKRYWRIKNSWGERRGGEGYFLIEPDAIAFTALTDVFYTTGYLKKPENIQYYRGPKTIEISGGTYEYYKTNWLGSISGKVYEAEKSGKKYAIKIVEKDKENTPVWELTKKEIRAHKIFQQDDHTNIVKLIASLETDNKLSMVFKYYEFGSLDHELEDGRVFPIHTALLYLQGIAQSLAYIHSKSGIHGDIHPRNILIDYNKICCLTGFEKTNFSVDRDQEKVDISAAIPPYFSIRNKLLYFLSFSFCLFATFYPRLQGLQSFKGYFLYLLTLFGIIAFLLFYSKAQVQNQDRIDEMKKKAVALERKRFFAYRADISPFGKVVAAMMLGEGFQRSENDKIKNRFDEDLTVAPLKDLCLSMLNDDPERRPAAQEIVNEISRLIKEGNQIYRSHILLKLPTGLRPNDGDEDMKIVDIASSYLYNRIYNESSLP